MTDQSRPDEPRTEAQEIGCEHNFGAVHQCPTCGTPRSCFTDERVTSRAFREKYGEPDWNESNRLAEARSAGAASLDVERACRAEVGPWFDEGHEVGRLDPQVLADRLLVRLAEGTDR